MVISRLKQRAARYLSTRFGASRSFNKPGNSPFTPPGLRGSSSLQAPPLLENGSYGAAVAGAVADAVAVGSPPAACGAPELVSLVSMIAWPPLTVVTLIMDDTTTRRAELRRAADRIDFFVSLGKAPNRQRAVSIPRIPSL